MIPAIYIKHSWTATYGSPDEMCGAAGTNALHEKRVPDSLCFQAGSYELAWAWENQWNMAKLPRQGFWILDFDFCSIVNYSCIISSWNCSFCISCVEFGPVFLLHPLHFFGTYRRLAQEMDSQDNWREMMQNHRDLTNPLNGDFLRFNGIYGILTGFI